MKYVNLMDTNYWSVPLRGLKYGDEKIDLYSSVERAVLDTGTSLYHMDPWSYNDWVEILEKNPNCGYTY